MFNLSMWNKSSQHRQKHIVTIPLTSKYIVYASGLKYLKQDSNTCYKSRLRLRVKKQEKGIFKNNNKDDVLIAKLNKIILLYSTS